MMEFRYWTVFMGVVTLLLAGSYLPLLRHSECNKTLWTFSGDDFEGFDNVSGIQTNTYIVPNYIHFLRVGPKMKEIPFMDFICILAAFKNQKPEKIFFHTDHDKFSGKYWEKLSALPGFLDIIKFVPTEIPLEIHGQPFSREDYHLFHAGDILRIRLLKKYGGIFLDNDSYLVQNMDVYRKFEMALGWDEGHEYLGTQILVAHKDARFLKLWEETYRDNYRPYLWYYNAGVRPTKVVLYNRPEVIHRVKLLFGTRDLRIELYNNFWPEWRKQYTIHLVVRHTVLFRSFFINGTSYILPDEFTEENIIHYPTTILDMVRDVYDI